MQRCCANLRFMVVGSQKPARRVGGTAIGNPYCSHPPHFNCHRSFSAIPSSSSGGGGFKPLFSPCSFSRPSLPFYSFSSSLAPFSCVQIRHISAKDKKRKKARERKPMTPVTSKTKKFKIKGFSSYKLRFRLMNDGMIRRWKAGKRHNAHSKSKEAKRRLRRPGTVPPAYAKTMKKLGFCA